MFVLFSLKMPGFLASMVCSNTGASPSGSSLPRLSFSSLENTQEGEEALSSYENVRNGTTGGN